MGYDLFEVKDFIEEKGLAENNMDLIVEYLKNPNYTNPLRRVIPKRNIPV